MIVRTLIRTVLDDWEPSKVLCAIHAPVVFIDALQFVVRQSIGVTQNPSDKNGTGVTQVTLMNLRIVELQPKIINGTWCYFFWKKVLYVKLFEQ